jgi:DNA-binding response OmpR family regulator
MYVSSFFSILRRAEMGMAYRADILVIEDDAALGDFILEALGEEGYTVRVIPDAAHASVALVERMPDLVMCDLRRPGRPGRDLIVQLQHTLPADVPIIVMISDDQEARQLDDLNVAFCLLKPFDLIELFACVAASIRVPS